jgi:adenine phosphoribosyltransferase
MNTSPVGNLAAIRRLVGVYRSSTTVKSGSNKFTTVNELTDQLPATRWDTLQSALGLLLNVDGPVLGDKILAEEDKGAIIAGLFSVATCKPLAMARMYSYDIPAHFGSVTVPITMEYASGHLLVNGIARGDRLTIIDDTLSTGGTAIGLIRAARSLGAEVVEMRVVIEKLGFGGRKRLLNDTGITVKSVLGISIDSDGRISVDEVLGRPITVEELEPEELE